MPVDHSTNEPRLNLGCGPVQPEGWVNIDGSNRALLATRFSWMDRLLVSLGAAPESEFGRRTTYHNLFKGLPFPDGSVAHIYAGELWEHFEYEDAARLTRDCHRALRPGGVLRVCVPDGATFWQQYLELYQREAARPRAARNPEALRKHVQMYFNDICTRKIWLGSMGHVHKWNFDDVQLIDMLESAGFTEVERMGFHDSRIPDIDRVERSDFLIVEGVKRSS